MNKNPIKSSWFLVVLFLVARLMLFAALPLNGLRGYGDLVHFYQLAGMGIPFFDFWVEFPPLFPFLSKLIFEISSKQAHVYTYMLIFVFSLAQALSLLLYSRLARRVYGENDSLRCQWIYFVLLLTLVYGWWYFEPLVVLATLLGLLWILKGRDELAGVAIAIGMMTKWFPVLLLAVSWRYRPFRRALLTTIITIFLVFLVLGPLFLASPRMTNASFLSQFNKGSWETGWALLDGNLITGNFGPDVDRYDPSKAMNSVGNPSMISPWIALVVFVGLGAWLYGRAKPINITQTGNERAAIAFFGLTWCLFLLWSPGYSPQWVLYLLPLILLSLPYRTSLLMAAVFVFLNLLEWPVLLSRGWFDALWILIPIRIIVVIILAVSFWQVIRLGGKSIDT